MDRTREAITEYREALAVLPPQSGGGIASQVFQVPLRVARLLALDSGDKKAAYEEARVYYRTLAGEQPGTPNAAEARSRLVDIATDLADWPQAIEEMRALEADVVQCDPPPQDPARIRLGIAEAQRSGLGDDDAALATLTGLLRDYPTGLSAALATLALARFHGSRGDSEKALGLLDGLARDFPDEEAVQAQAGLYRAKVLERAGRWNEALKVLRTLPIDYPLSDAALDSHMELIRHYREAGDDDALSRSLAGAESAYRDFLDRYPSEGHSMRARERLIQVLLEEEHFIPAVDELVRLADALGAGAGGAKALWSAARLAELRLADTQRAIALFTEVGTRFAGTPTAELAAREVERLRAGDREP
jgi:TolA-binding protein